MKKKYIYPLLLISSLIINSCASTSIIYHKIGSSNSLCKNKSTLVLWGTAWRKDQKEKELREEIASKSLSKYLSSSKCFYNYKLLKEINGKSAITLSDIEAINFSKTLETNYDNIIFIRLEELGPLLNLNLSLVLFDGATEVKLRVRSVDTKTNSLEYDNQSQWKNGGPYVIKGINTLEQDMYDSLKNIFETEN